MIQGEQESKRGNGENGRRKGNVREDESGLTCLAVSAGPRLTVTLVVTTGRIYITCLRLFAASLMYCACNQFRNSAIYLQEYRVCRS
jgi:hypothetical protein